MIDRIRTALVGRYTIERELGAGGMATVYLAEDVKHRRRVAVKVLRPELSASLGSERFLREIETTANLRHPHILPLYDSGEADGLLFYVMPLVEGESLRDRLAREKQLPIEDALRIAREVADALSYAHARGVIHRDIKPENILLESGHAVVADFGIARALSEAGGETLTQTGVSIGTPLYMSPEQASGSPDLDGRSDLYSLACVLYEMLAGQPPFTGPTAAAITRQHLVTEAPPVTNLRPAVPAIVMSTLQRALAKNPADRFNPVAQFAEAIQPGAVTASTASIAAPSPPQAVETKRGRQRAPMVVVIIAAVVTTTFFATRDRVGKSSAGDSAKLDAIAVLPFVNTSGDAKDEYFSDGMTDELTHALSKLPGLRLAGRSSSFSYKGKSVPAPEIGKTLGVGAIIEGTVRRSGDRLRITAQLTNASDGRVIWSDSFERAGTDVFAVQDGFTTAIVEALTPLLSGEPAPMAKSGDTRGTSDATAYDFYLRGRYYWAQRGADPLDSALLYFSEAVKRDPAFARGWAGLAQTHVIRPNFNVTIAALPAFAAAEEAAQKALRFDSTLADAHLALGMLQLRRLDLTVAGKEFELARRLEPENATAHHWSAIYYSIVGDSAQAFRAIDKAISLDPLSATTMNSRSVMLVDQRRFKEADDGLRRAIQISPSFEAVFSSQTRTAIWNGKADSVARVRAGKPASGKTRLRWGSLVVVVAAAGQWDEARRIRGIIDRPGNAEVAASDRALAALAFGEYPRAAELFVQSIEHEGAIANLLFSMCDVYLDPVRDQPVFDQFRLKHGLPKCALTSPWPIKPPKG